MELNLRLLQVTQKHIFTFFLDSTAYFSIILFSFIFLLYYLLPLPITGIVQISQLFMRWLALMPGADHSNLINPPGLTVMRILGGKYRVTAAHRVIWQ
jgi:hypothetical protein